MQPGTEAELGRMLAGAELWIRLERDADPGSPEGGGPGDPAIGAEAPPGSPVMVAGWEDGFAACAPTVAGDGGDHCRACPVGLVTTVLRERRAMDDTCSSGVRLLAFPAPAGSRVSAAVLRLDPRPSGQAGAPDPRVVLTAARRLRDPDGLVTWQAEQRRRGAERRRTAASALAQMIATTEEFHRLYTSADRDRASAESSATRLDTLARETLRDSERARTQVAHVLHDTAAQSMVSAHRFLDAARASLAGPRPEAAPAHLDAAQERLLAAIREVRAVLNELVPPGLEELGIANALAIHVRDNVPGGIVTEVTGELPRTERWLESELFAMAVEAVGNAVQHAQTSAIRVELRASQGRAVISVTDDGVGFDPAVAPRTTRQGMGLIGMTKRAGWLGGRLDVSSRPGAGTTVRISVPLHDPGAVVAPEPAATEGREPR